MITHGTDTLEETAYCSACLLAKPGGADGGDANHGAVAGRAAEPARCRDAGARRPAHAAWWRPPARCMALDDVQKQHSYPRRCVRLGRRGPALVSMEGRRDGAASAGVAGVSGAGPLHTRGEWVEIVTSHEAGARRRRSTPWWRRREEACGRGGHRQRRLHPCGAGSGPVDAQAAAAPSGDAPAAPCLDGRVQATPADAVALAGTLTAPVQARIELMLQLMRGSGLRPPSASRRCCRAWRSVERTWCACVVHQHVGLQPASRAG